MFEKEADEIANKKLCANTICYNHCSFNSPKHHRCGDWHRCYECAKDGAEFGYSKANEWHRVSDKLPEMDVFVYLWKEGEDFPVVARRHLPYGQKEWVWDCMWGSGFTISQLKGKDYLWKEMVLPKVAVKFDVPHSKADQELNLENNLTDLGIM